MAGSSGQRASRRSTLALAALGLALEGASLSLTVRGLIFTHLYGQPIDIVTILGPGVPGMVSFTLPVLGAFLGYGAALLLVRRLDPAQALVLVLVFATAQAVTLALMFPALALDVFHYVADARTLWLHHENPLTVAPDAHPDSAVYPYTAWYKQPSPYGPLWSALTLVVRPAGLGGVVPPVLAFKGLAIAFYLGTGLLIYDYVRRVRPGWQAFAALMFLWNPLVLLEVAGNGHNDVAMMFLVVLALSLARARMPGPALLLLFVAALVKFVALLLVPLLALWFLRSGNARDRRWTMIGLLAGVAVAVLVYVPFWDGTATLDSARGQSDILANSPAAVSARLLAPVASDSTAEAVARWVFGGLFGAIYAAVLAVLLWRRRPFEFLLLASVTAVFFYLVFAAFWFQPWYLVWLLPLAALVPYRRMAAAAGVFTLTAALLYVPIDFVWQTYFLVEGPTWPHRIATLVVFPLPLLVWVWSVRARRRIAEGQPLPATASPLPWTSPP